MTFRPTHILILGAALATLSLAACQKSAPPADNSVANAPAAADNSMANAAANTATNAMAPDANASGNGSQDGGNTH